MPGCDVSGVAERFSLNSMFKVSRGDLVQGKEQWLCFAKGAKKRHPTSKVRETQLKCYVLQEGNRGQTH